MAAGVAWIVPVEYWLLIGWDVTCLVYLTTVWIKIWPRSVPETARLAEYTDPTRAQPTPWRSARRSRASAPLPSSS